MKIHSEYMTVQTEKKREFLDITPNVRSAAEKSGIHNGIILICSLHANSGVFVNEGDPAFQQDMDAWLEKLAPATGDYKYGQRAESTGGVHLQSILLNGQAVISLQDGKIELGPWQNIIYAELDGLRPKRILIKVLGE
jgi:secondary thiamine-phosphate synthase enzyme